MLGERIKRLRLSKGVSQKDIAQYLGVTQQAVGSWERNKSEPTPSMYKLLARYFGVSTDYLLGNNTQNVNNVDESDLLDGYRHLNFEGQKLVMSMIGSLRLSHAAHSRSV